jgi:hypothetical protein
LTAPEEIFFALMQNAPSGRMHVQVTLKKIIYDAFEKRCCENPTKAIRPRWGRYALFPLDRARTFITLLVVLHHSVIQLHLFRQWRQDALARL